MTERSCAAILAAAFPLAACGTQTTPDPVGALESVGSARIGGTRVVVSPERIVFDDPVETTDYAIGVFVVIIVAFGVYIAWTGGSRVLAVAIALLAGAGLVFELSHTRFVDIDIARRDVTLRDGLLWGLVTESEVTRFDDLDGVMRVSRIDQRDDDDAAHFVGVALQRHDKRLIPLFEERVNGYVEPEKRQAAALRDHVAERAGLPIVDDVREE